MSEDWREVSARVFVRRHASLDLNVGLVVGDVACLVVDTRATEVEGRELVDAVRRVTSEPWTVVTTHHHFDHAFGTSVFRPARVWSHRRCAETLRIDGERTRVRIAAQYRQNGQEQQALDIEATRIDPADHVVADDGAVLDIGGREVQLRYFGRAHTDNDLCVVVPDAHVVLAGDLVEEGAPPQFGDAYPLDWAPTLDALLEQVSGTVVPGHGDVVDANFVRGQRDQHAAVARLSRAGHAEGRPVADVARELTFLGMFASKAVERAYAQLS